MDRRRFRDSRGATLVEYALVVALVVVPSIGAIARVNDNSSDYYSNASDDIGDLPQSGIDNTPVSSTPQASTSTTAAPTTSTSAAPSTTTTAPPTTTTTIPTTTTTMPTTTTTLLRSTISDFEDISRNDGSKYDATARAKIVRSDTGLAVRNASVTIRMVDAQGSTRTRTCTTDSTGRCSVTWNRSDNRAPVLATVTNVNASPSWDGVGASVNLVHP